MHPLRILSLARTSSRANAVLGAWLVLSPWSVGAGASSGVAWAEVVTGVLVGILAMMRSMWPRENVGLSWANVLLGAWTALLPWTLDFLDKPAQAWNCVFVGLGVILFGGWSRQATVLYRTHVAEEEEAP
jgi:hypothetical protein